MERSLKGINGKVDASERARIEEALENAKEALAGDDTEEIKRRQEVLLSASHALSEMLYQGAQQQDAATGTATPGGNPDEKAEDSEIIDEDEDEKKG